MVKRWILLLTALWTVGVVAWGVSRTVRSSEPVVGTWYLGKSPEPRLKVNPDGTFVRWNGAGQAATGRWYKVDVWVENERLPSGESAETFYDEEILEDDAEAREKLKRGLLFPLLSMAGYRFEPVGTPYPALVDDEALAMSLDTEFYHRPVPWLTWMGQTIQAWAGGDQTPERWPYRQ